MLELRPGGIDPWLIDGTLVVPYDAGTEIGHAIGGGLAWLKSIREVQKMNCIPSRSRKMWV